MNLILLTPLPKPIGIAELAPLELKLALQYHGLTTIKGAKIDVFSYNQKDFFFIRGGKKCKVFTKSSKAYVERKLRKQNMMTK